MKKIGLFGGTFDPPHIGHLIVAEEVREALDLTEIWFIPSHIPPHKDGAKTSSGHRLNMIKEAIKNNPRFKVDPIELNRGGISYTIDTVTELKKRDPDAEFYFIIGADMVEFLPNWHKVDLLKQLVQFVGVKRYGYDLKRQMSVSIVEIPGIDISSSVIRQRIQEGKGVRYWLPDRVEWYIREHGLYGCK
ncbi:nicotinate-nucleotide adenylyltransferase [Melghiribacillus thermohalophilus]|uniref:Probable nicotinate-nucleotide adenylyltransferase n=1 Tax=Melghiribacillus thermohalophilus TaxID=1324956 RepID=A0A4V2V2Y8_9BACI|nr:nicotinate-nucleotide adenylyltransferase [Melghiribacillus thermohalophilus]TCT27051.1 nicotinate-nucleotide adenylyltransferase [Melghiribacillus thermohalophilus]